METGLVLKVYVLCGDNTERNHTKPIAIRRTSSPPTPKTARVAVEEWVSGWEGGGRRFSKTVCSLFHRLLRAGGSEMIAVQKRLPLTTPVAENDGRRRDAGAGRQNRRMRGVPSLATRYDVT